jgi:hypothetical protein
MSARDIVKFQFKPGQSGNPKGRPKNKSMETIAREILNETVEAPNGLSASKRELLMRLVYDEAMKRNWKAIGAILARDWPVPLKHEVSGPNGGPIMTLAEFVQLSRDDVIEDAEGGIPEEEADFHDEKPDGEEGGAGGHGEEHPS